MSLTPDGDCATRDGDQVKRAATLGSVCQEYRTAASTWSWTAIRDLQRSLHPILDSFGREVVDDLPVSEADESGLTDPPGFASPLFRPMKYEAHLTVELREVLEFDVDAFLTTLYDVADDVGGQMVAGMLAHVGQVADDNGQVVESDGDIFEGLLRALETISIDFNEDGSHNLQVFLHPDTASELASRTPTEDQTRRREEILERRRREWRDSRRRQHLPELPDRA